MTKQQQTENPQKKNDSVAADTKEGQFAGVSSARMVTPVKALSNNELQRMVNNSPRVAQLRAYQDMANEFLKSKNEKATVAAGNGAPIQLFSPAKLYKNLVEEMLPSLSTSSGPRTAESDIFKGATPDERKIKEARLRTILAAGAKLENVYDQAAYVSSRIKGEQLFIDSNTRLSTLAVYLIYESTNDKRIKATPLEAFAAIAEKELSDRFEYADWLKAKEVPPNHPEAAGVPGARELENLKIYSAAIAKTRSLYDTIFVDFREFCKSHTTRDQAIADWRESQKDDPRLEDWTDEEELGHKYKTPEEQYAGFLTTLSPEDVLIWSNKALIDKGVALIGNGRFFESIETEEVLRGYRTPHLFDLLSEVTGLPVKRESYEQKTEAADSDDEDSEAEDNVSGNEQGEEEGTDKERRDSEDEGNASESEGGNHDQVAETSDHDESDSEAEREDEGDDTVVEATVRESEDVDFEDEDVDTEDQMQQGANADSGEDGNDSDSG